MSTVESAPSAAALGSTPRILAEGLLHRGQLASLEFGEARSHAAKTGALAAAACAFALLGGFTGTLALAALVWDREDRSLILGLVALAYLAGTAGFAWWAASRFMSWRPMAESRNQIREDCTCIIQCLPAKTR
jgi:hypothetical protein